MLFGSSRNLVKTDQELDIEIKNRQILVNKAKKVGVIVDFELLFRNYITTLIQRAYTSLK